MTEYYKINIDLLCKRFGISRDKLGNFAGLGRGAVASYVIGVTKPSVTFLFMLEQMTGIPMSKWMYFQIKIEEIPDRPRQGWKHITPENSLSPQEHPIRNSEIKEHATDEPDESDFKAVLKLVLDKMTAIEKEQARLRQEWASKQGDT